jgi:hypothetical protein
MSVSVQLIRRNKGSSYSLAPIDADVVNDPCSVANAVVPAGFADSLAADRFIGNVGRNSVIASVGQQ